MQYKAATVETCVGDITQIDADGLITLVNSTGMWSGGVDGAIMRLAGDSYHDTVSAVLMKGKPEQGKAIFADGANTPDHAGRFYHVIFVIDDLKLPLRSLVYAGLVEAYKHGLHSITLPLMRTGVKASFVEKTPTEVAAQTMSAIKQATDEYMNWPMSIKLVIYTDRDGSLQHTLDGQARLLLQ